MYAVNDTKRTSSLIVKKAVHETDLVSVFFFVL